MIDEPKENEKQEDEEFNSEGDVVFESEEDLSDTDVVKKLRNRLKQVTVEKQEYLDGWQRSKADLVNVKREFSEDKTKLIEFAKMDLVFQLIPVLDSFEIAFCGNDEMQEKTVQEWLVGMRHIYSQLISVLKENGVEQSESLGKKFDHNFHTSVGIVKVEDEKFDGIITEVVQKGYSLNGVIIRPANVKVGEFGKEDTKT
jgi:molecular chaperone GrpE